jgi:[glutamine synthetase] adenylyltransferase / [glutamine synthetase]-adenylyl-L-tyrosine phosphorylase
LSDQVTERWQRLRDSPRFSRLRDVQIDRLQALLHRGAVHLREQAASAQQTDAALLRWLDWSEQLVRRESYLVLLWERPQVHARLLNMLGAAIWPSRYLMRHPAVIDELADLRAMGQRFDAAHLEAELQVKWQSLARTNEADEENLMNVLRRAHHAEVFRTLVRDVGGQLSVEQVSDDLSAAADAVLRICLRWIWPLMQARYPEARALAEPSLAVVAYGKLGGKELGYGSDLDLVFVYDDADPALDGRAAEIYAAFVRKLINWLSTKTAEGDLFEIDTALRPNGNAGLLVTHVEAFEAYQGQRGSNAAWTWEHQAITRARVVFGPHALRQRIEAARIAVLSSPRDAPALLAEIGSMRQRVAAAHPVQPGMFDVKHSAGGMVDIEFAVQALVLAHSATQPTLTANIGNIGLLLRAGELGLIPACLAAGCASAYRSLRKAQHQARLNEAPTQWPEADFAAERGAVQALLKAVGLTTQNAAI